MKILSILKNIWKKLLTNCLCLFTINKRLENDMGRPRTLNIHGGQVILKNLSLDKVEEITLALTGKGSAKEVQLETEIALEPAAFENKETALGLRKNMQGQWELVTVAYNLDSRESAIESVEVLGTDKMIAQGKFRVKVADKLF